MMLRGRDRLFATAAIWIAFAVMLNNVVDRFTRVSADFNGLWPNFNYYPGYPGPQMTITDEEIMRLQEVYENASRLSESMLNTVTESVNAQLASNLPILVVLALALILAATLSTFFVWRNAHLETEAPAQSRRDAKMKRGGRVEQVMNALDADEIEELRTRLVEAESGEAIPLEELLAARGARR